MSDFDTGLAIGIVIGKRMGSVTPPPQADGVYDLLADVTVNAVTTAVDITGLGLTKDDEILLVIDLVHANPTGGYGLALFVNGNNTTTNYYLAYSTLNGASLTSGLVNVSEVIGVFGDKKAAGRVKINLTSQGYLQAASVGQLSYADPTALVVHEWVTSTFTVASINSIRLQAGTTNGIGIGSRFQLYRKGTSL